MYRGHVLPLVDLVNDAGEEIRQPLRGGNDPRCEQRLVPGPEQS
jgi:hypothetical protein